MIGSGVGSKVGVLVGDGVIVGVEVSVGTIVRLGVGVSVGNISTAPTQEESSRGVNINRKTEVRVRLIVVPSFHPTGECECPIKDNGY
jgi:hypothetical protein